MWREEIADRAVLDKFLKDRDIFQSFSIFFANRVRKEGLNECRFGDIDDNVKLLKASFNKSLFFDLQFHEHVK